ncbi:MAG: hypothetical protein ACR2I8_00760 [Steroidobacteraceae bacterium]
MVSRPIAAIVAAVLFTGYAARDGHPPRFGGAAALNPALRVAEPGLPPGHPPLPGMLPPGHPPVGEARPALPPGHPPIQGDCPADRAPWQGEFDVESRGHASGEIETIRT